ncbi:hypothetical protein GCM10008997_19180 [Halomonas salifodinae]
MTNIRDAIGTVPPRLGGGPVRDELSHCFVAPVDTYLGEKRRCRPVSAIIRVEISSMEKRVVSIWGICICR